MGVRLKHSKKSEKNLAHFRFQIPLTQPDTEHPDTIMVCVDSCPSCGYVIYEDFKGTMMSLFK